MNTSSLLSDVSKFEMYVIIIIFLLLLKTSYIYIYIYMYSFAIEIQVTRDFWDLLVLYNII